MKKKRPVSHSEVIRHICDNLDLKPRSKKCLEMKKHLSACPDCLAYLDSVKKTISLYKLYPTPRLSKSGRKRLFAVVPIR
jgi:hypothetical protein